AYVSDKIVTDQYGEYLHVTVLQEHRHALASWHEPPRFLIEVAPNDLTTLIHHVDVAVNKTALRVGVEKCYLFFELRRIPRVVGIQVGDQFAGGGAERHVASGGGASIRLIHVTDS